MTSRYGRPRPQTGLGTAGAQWLQGYLVYSEAVEPGVQVWEHRVKASAAEASVLLRRVWRRAPGEFVGCTNIISGQSWKKAADTASWGEDFLGERISL